MEALEKQIKELFDKLETNLNNQFEAVNKRLDSLIKKLDKIENKLSEALELAKEINKNLTRH